MTTVLSLIKQFCTLDFVERSCEKALLLLTQDITWYGTSDAEDVSSLEEARQYIYNEMRLLPTPYTMTLLDEKTIPTGEASGVAFLRMRLTNAGVRVTIRITAASKVEDGVEKLCTMHFSVADSAQEAHEYFPVRKGRQHLARAREELVMSTMAGGMMGGYCEPGFPFYYINTRMLEYLGYGNEEEFIADIHGKIINCMHPEDRQRVENSTNEQLSTSGQYTVDYRMKKQDGSYLWMRDIGRQITTEDERQAIISVCYDINEDHAKQVQLENLVNTVPGGMALYRLTHGQLELLYQSDGVGALTGRSPEEYATLVKDNIWASIHKEDVDKCRAAVLQVAKVDHPVSIDYRVPHKDGGYVWITANLCKIREENGCPIIHTVYTEMPQLHELMYDITENANAAIVVTDKNTRELLYINKVVWDELGEVQGAYFGQKCYQYLLGRTTPCDFCDESLCDAFSGDEREVYIPELNRHYAVRGHLSNWAGHEARVEYLFDVSEAKEAQQRLQEMAQNVSCGLCVVTVRPPEYQPVYQFMNDGFCELFEHPREEALRIIHSDAAYGFHPEDRQLAHEMRRKIFAGSPHEEITYRYVLPDGRVKWINDTINTIHAKDGSATLYATFTDVTRQREQDAQLRDVITHIPGGICLYRWNGAKLEPLIVSEQFSQLLGEDAKALLKRTAGTDYTHTHPDDLPGLKEAIAKGLKEGSVTHVYRSFNSKTKEYLWLHMQSNAVPQADGTYLVYVSYTDITAERLMAQKLQTSEMALETAAKHAGLWYWKFDTETHIANFDSRCMEDFSLPAVLYNYPDSWLKMGIILPEYCQRYGDAVHEMSRGKQEVVFDAQVQLPDKSLHWAEFRFKKLPDSSSTAVCTGRLIDDQKLLEISYALEKLKPSLGQTDLLFHATFDLFTGKTLDYVSVLDNKSLVSQRPTLDETNRQLTATIVGDEMRRRFNQINTISALTECAQKGESRLSLDFRRRLKDGRILWVRHLWSLVKNPATGKLVAFEYCYDIHTQKMAEEMLMTSSTFDYYLLASIYASMGKMSVYASARADLKGEFISYEDTRALFVRDMPTEKDREDFLRHSDLATITHHVEKEGIYTYQCKNLRSDGTPGTFKVHFAPYDMENRIYIMTMTDITDLLAAEKKRSDQMLQALEVAQQANRSKTEFLSSMSHDIRTPMNAIMGMCDLALSDEKDARQVHESLEIIKSSSTVLLSLINNILDMRRIESGKMKLTEGVFSLTQEAELAERRCRVLAQQKNQTFRLHLSLHHDTCRGDVSRLNSALDNILANAIKYTPEGGTITYCITETASDKEGIGLFRFEISDTGIGISAKNQAHIFEPFYRAEDESNLNEEGSGLGLSIAKAIVDLKGGTISVHSMEGSGTTFVVIFPLHLADEGSVVKKHTAHKPTIGAYDLSGIHILLCEDHPINQKVVSRILEKAKARVTIASDGKIGFDRFKESAAGTYQIILMDIRMPKMDGFEAARAIRTYKHPQSATIPIIALSANAFNEDVQLSLQNGMNAHLSKPVVPTQLYETILHYTGGAEQDN